MGVSVPQEAVFAIFIGGSKYCCGSGSAGLAPVIACEAPIQPAAQHGAPAPAGLGNITSAPLAAAAYGVAGTAAAVVPRGEGTKRKWTHTQALRLPPLSTPPHFSSQLKTPHHYNCAAVSEI